MKKETNASMKKNVVTPDRRVNHSKNNDKYAHSPINISNKNIKRNLSEDKIIDKRNRSKVTESHLKREKEKSKEKDRYSIYHNQRHYNDIINRYNNSPSPTSVENSNTKSNISKSPLNKRVSKTTNINNNIKSNSNNNVKEQNQYENDIYHTSYTKYDSSLQYSNASCSSISCNNANKKHFNYYPGISQNSQKVSNQSPITQTQITSNKKAPYHYQKIQSVIEDKSPRTSVMNQNKIINITPPSLSHTAKESYYKYSNYTSYCSSNNNDISNAGNISTQDNNNNYQRIPIRSKLLNEASSIQSKLSSSHSPLINKTSNYSYSNPNILATRTHSTGNATFEDSHFDKEEKKGKIETIEELHFAFVNMIQNAKQLIIIQEDDKTKERDNPFSTVSDFDERVI